MKKLIFLSIIVLILWRLDIIGIALIYFKTGYISNATNYQENNISYYQDENISDTIDSFDSNLKPKTKTKQFSSDKKSLNHVLISAKKTKYKKKIKSSKKYKCDGRVWCSQMHSCEEAIYFINHCPGTKMDGDGDGRPCEKQWCGH